MTLVTDILSRAARQCSVGAPSSWLTATDDTFVELRDDFLVDTAQDILDRLDLTQPVGAMASIDSITGTYSAGVAQVGVVGNVGTYSLPTTFRRLQRGALAVYENAGTRRACIAMPNDGDWQHLISLGSAGADRFYRLRGYPGAYEIDFYREASEGINISVQYVTEYWLQNGGTLKSEFTAPEDESLFPRRLVEAGIIWRWRDRRGLSAESKRMEYEALLARYSNDSHPRRKVIFGGGDRAVRWQDVVPDVIPS